MNTSYKRYWEPSTTQALVSSLGVAGVVSALVYPIEFIKTRIQVRAEGIGMRTPNMGLGYNPFKIFREIHESGRGTKGAYEGLQTFVSARLVHLFVRNLIYKVVYDQVKPVKASNDLTNREKGVLAGFAGATAALVSNPLDCINVRQQGNGGVYLPNRRNLSSLSEAWAQLSSEGPRAWFRGGFSNVVRAVLLNVSLTGPYDMLKEKCWTTFGDADTFNHNFALTYASLIATLVVLPVDTVRTRLYMQFADPSKNRINYLSFSDCFLKIFQNEGIFSYYCGFWTFYLRTHLYAFSTVYLMDLLNTRWKKQAGLLEWQI